MIKDYSKLTDRIYTQLSPELSQEFHNMLTNMAQEISRLYEIDNAKPSEALDITNTYLKVFEEEKLDVIYDIELFKKDINTIEQALLKAQEQEKVLSIIIDREVSIQSFRRKDYKDYEDYCNRSSIYENSTLLTEEEFILLKRYMG